MNGFAEEDAIKCEVGVLRQLVENSGVGSRDKAGSTAGLKEGGFSGGGDNGSGDARSICTIVLHELDRVDKEDEIARQEQQEPRPDNEEEEEEEERRRRVKLGRPRIPETMGLWMIHLPMEDDEEPRRRSSPRSYSVINQLFQRLTTLDLARIHSRAI